MMQLKQSFKLLKIKSMPEFRIFFEHTDYGYYSTSLEEHETIQEALDYFAEHYKYKKIYGIMEI